MTSSQTHGSYIMNKFNKMNITHSRRQDIRNHLTHSWKIETIHAPISVNEINIDS